MQTENKNNQKKDNKIQKVKDEGINLNDYAGDEHDNKAAKQQADKYMKDLDKNLNKQMGGNDSVPTEPNKI